MGNIFNKLWPYILGAGVLLAAVIAGPNMTQQMGRRHNANLFAKAPAKPVQRAEKPKEPAQDAEADPLDSDVTANTNRLPMTASMRASTDAPALPDGLTPIVADQPPILLYRIIADGLIIKLKPKSITPTCREYEALVMSAADGLRKELGLVLPDGYVLPKSVPSAWMQAPEFKTLQDYAYVRRVATVNREYVKVIITQLLDDYSTRIIELLTTRFNAVLADRQAADKTTVEFIEELYGPDFIKKYTIGHRVIERHRGGQQALAFPPLIIHRAEDEIASLWRTEFTDAELEQVKDFIVQNNLKEKLRDDLFQSSLPEEERGLIQSTMLGLRIMNLHGLSEDIVAAYSVKLNDPPPPPAPKSNSNKS
jgi:hypothetical protein